MRRFVRLGADVVETIGCGSGVVVMTVEIVVDVTQFARPSVNKESTLSGKKLAHAIIILAVAISVTCSYTYTIMYTATV